MVLIYGLRIKVAPSNEIPPVMTVVSLVKHHQHYPSSQVHIIVNKMYANTQQYRSHIWLLLRKSCFANKFRCSRI